jgi:hypothetical protein
MPGKPDRKTRRLSRNATSCRTGSNIPTSKYFLFTIFCGSKIINIEFLHILRYTSIVKMLLEIIGQVQRVCGHYAFSLKG